MAKQTIGGYLRELVGQTTDEVRYTVLRGEPISEDLTSRLNCLAHLLQGNWVTLKTVIPQDTPDHTFLIEQLLASRSPAKQSMNTFEEYEKILKVFAPAEAPA